MKTVTLVPGLSVLADRYRAVVCDVWGVLHNGVVGYGEAGEALRRFRADGRPVVLLTNAPRPAYEVEAILARFGIPRDAYDCIVTSGDACRGHLKREGAVRVLHLGPPRDLPLFEGLKLDLVGEEEAELVVCTGLFDDDTETAEDYRALLGRCLARGLRMFCANPDIVVERGDRLIYCAGAIAQLYDDMGGETVMFGKPHKPVYDIALETVAEIAGEPIAHHDVLAIGDALPTDVKGAWGQGLPVLMVTAGIHAADFGPADAPDPAAVAKRLAIEGLEITAAVPRLVW
ncbi:TIGR01459 family HAD-type hydrolase [Oharaeibacter diazotrophicus]|uniref:HAD superfamily hydrolase (TIGR01459 family) n=1 Tax=Oharaeibacter diazotrophicus TaxID=1920512 RepID=A0A4R6RBK5_9HYPH|nr:TIGR01459 family HAD-type hydrolase [Oharaeibacter diazotrophicus]TDP83452.1 HAD superfamily hydrolase (TIGR01459 family) [Oharaeibacter diazotrophicus]BBE72285.1 UMP phosphatase [Pleomorphomonas sp. SM30]GLS79055.1 haloacid dehalogenase [Oharaeibacter diazotrophicus]